VKEVLAVIRMNKMNETKQALVEAGIASFTARKVAGRGKGKVDYRLLKGAEEGHEEAISQLGPGPKMVPKRMLIVVVRDQLVPRVVNTIIEVNQTGNRGDGKIFVMPVQEAIRIRTGECDNVALDESVD
jgi:nitrogen regulatory protein PII 2